MYNNSKLKIFYVDDVGPITKIYYTLKRISNMDQRVISVDDDFIYNCEMLNMYSINVRENSNVAIGFSGIWDLKCISNCNGDIKGIDRPYTPVYVGLLQGYKSVYYKRDFFNDLFFDKWYNIFHEDDVLSLVG